VFEAACSTATQHLPLWPDPAAEFREAAASLVAGWQEHRLDCDVRTISSAMPGELVFNMTPWSTWAHGWDLAVATGQPIS
jgi:hypothetical protein